MNTQDYDYEAEDRIARARADRLRAFLDSEAKDAEKSGDRFFTDRARTKLSPVAYLLLQEATKGLLAYQANCDSRTFFRENIVKPLAFLSILTKGEEELTFACALQIQKAKDEEEGEGEEVNPVQTFDSLRELMDEADPSCDHFSDEVIRMTIATFGKGSESWRGLVPGWLTIEEEETDDEAHSHP